MSGPIRRLSPPDSADGKTCLDGSKPVVARKVGLGLEFRVERYDQRFCIWWDQGE